MKRRRLVLAPVELLLMKAIWRLGRATVQEVRDAVTAQRELAYTTVLTMLRSLEGKGFLTHEEVNRRYVYRPLVSEQEVSSSMLRDMLNRVFDGSRELLLTQLFELGRIEEEELTVIRRKLSEAGNRHSTQTPTERSNE